MPDLNAISTRGVIFSILLINEGPSCINSTIKQNPVIAISLTDSKPRMHRLNFNGDRFLKLRFYASMLFILKKQYILYLKFNYNYDLRDLTMNKIPHPHPHPHPHPLPKGEMVNQW